MDDALSEKDASYEAWAEYLIQRGVTLADRRAPLPLGVLDDAGCEAVFDRCAEDFSSWGDSDGDAVSSRSLIRAIAAALSVATRETTDCDVCGDALTPGDDVFVVHERCTTTAALSTSALPPAEGLREIIAEWLSRSRKLSNAAQGYPEGEPQRHMVRQAEVYERVAAELEYALSHPVSDRGRRETLEEAAQRERQYCNDLARGIERDIRALSTPGET